MRVAIVVASVVVLGSVLGAVAGSAAGRVAVYDGTPSRTRLDDRWAIQSSLGVDASPQEVSRPGFPTNDWFPVTVPSTVLGGLVADHEYGNLFTGTALQSVWEPRFEVPWWYRTEFELAGGSGARTQLRFDGINYRADVYVNGRLVADRDRVAGAFRVYTFDVTDLVHPGANALAVLVYPVDANHDLTVTWVDWNPLAPDHGMGIWHDVWLIRTGAVTVRDPQVVSDLPLPDTHAADLSVTATVHNAGDTPVTVDVAGAIGSISFSRSISLDAGGSRLVTFDPSSFPQLHLTDPPLWWPYQMGDQAMEELVVTASVGGVESDRATTSFGIREVTSEYMANGARRFLINGRPMLIRGGGWASDILLRPVPRRVDDQLRYTRAMGLNTVRLEGKLESDHFFDEADRLGILVLPGWMCCDNWQRSGTWTDAETAIARASMTSQAIRMRDHPSVIAFLIGSDTVPVVGVQEMYVKALRDARWPNPILASASADRSTVLGPTGVKMTGPYDWVPPGYWYDPRADGGASGFNTETSAGQSIPELEDVRRMLSPDERTALWTEPRTPQYHAGVGDSVFKTFRVFDRAMTARMGAPTSLADYVRKAQIMAYENERAMFEAFSRNRYRATGVIQWMLNNAWPSLHWNLFDWFLEPNGSTFGVEVANQPLHVQYSYDDRSVAVVNQTTEDATGLTVRARVFDIHGEERWSRSEQADVGADGVARSFRVPQQDDISSTYFLELTMTDAAGEIVSRNVYWLSTVRERLAWRRSTWFYTPTSTYADFTALRELPRVRPTIVACAGGSGDEGTMRVTVTNDTSDIAFFVRTRLTAGRDGVDVTPITWTDGYITLMPGEEQTLSASYAMADLRGAEPSLEISGWNVPSSRPSVVACP